MNVRAIIGRAGWGLGDQAFSSLTNFALGVVVAREVAPAAFGAYALAFATYTIALGASRAVATEPFVIRFTTSSEVHRRDGARASAGAAVVMGVFIGLGCATFGLLSTGDARGAFLAVGLTMPGLLLQDSWRYIFFAGRRGAQAMLNDIVWAIVLFGSMAVLHAVDRTSVWWLTLAWGGSASVAAIVGIVQARVLPQPHRALAWVGSHRDLIPAYLGEFGAVSGARQVPVYALGAFGTLVEAGALRAANMILGPLHILFMGIRLVAVPEGVRLLERSTQALRRACAFVAGGLSASGLAWGTIALLLPTSVGTALLGQTWFGAREVLLPLTLMLAGGGWSFGAVVGLRSLAAARRGFTGRLISSTTQMTGGVVGAVVAGASGAAWGLAAGAWLGAVALWMQFRRALDEHVPAPVSFDDVDALVEQP